MYWNINSLTNLGFARGGRVLDSYEPMGPHDAADAEVRAALDGIDWVDYADTAGKGLVAVEKFTGHGIRAEDARRITDAATGYRIPQH
jgi:hypothetical protein